MTCKVSGNQQPLKSISLIKWLLISSRQFYMYFYTFFHDMTLIETLAKSMVIILRNDIVLFIDYLHSAVKQNELRALQVSYLGSTKCVYLKNCGTWPIQLMISLNVVCRWICIRTCQRFQYTRWNATLITFQQSIFGVMHEWVWGVCVTFSTVHSYLSHFIDSSLKWLGVDNTQSRIKVLPHFSLQS